MSIAVGYDTMLFLQAASRPHRTRATFDAVHDGRLTLCVSTEVLAEVQDVLTRPENVARFPALTAQAVDAFIDDILSRAKLFELVPRRFTWPQHPDDDHVFNLAIVAQAKYLVTWESRILSLPRGTSAATKLLKELAPDLSIVSPDVFSASLPRLT